MAQLSTTLTIASVVFIILFLIVQAWHFYDYVQRYRFYEMKRALIRDRVFNPPEVTIPSRFLQIGFVFGMCWLCAGEVIRG